VLRSYGAFGEKTMYGKKVEGVIRSTFVIDPAGSIESAQYGVKATGHVDRLLRQLQI
jgi:peroxiredoxin Q/BCP